MDFHETAPVFVQRVDSLSEQLSDIQERIQEKAYERFLTRGASHGHDLDDWIAAESELLITPAITVSEHGSEIAVEARFPKGHLEDLRVFVTMHEALLTSVPADAGQVFGLFQFPSPINFETIDAEVDGDVFRFVATFAGHTEDVQLAHAHIA